MVDSRNYSEVERTRLVFQARLDSAKTQLERNRLGQFATPSELALDIVESTRAFLDNRDRIRFLDPAFGTGAFYSALLRALPQSQIDHAQGYEIDPHYGIQAERLWKDTGLDLEILDFTLAEPPQAEEEKATLLICNPPYVRHHHLSADEKARLQRAVLRSTGLRLSGLSGLYCYFLLLADTWMAQDGIGCWLVPSEFLDVNYGAKVKEYLLQQVTLLRVHWFNPENVQFKDAIVSSVVIWFRKQKPVTDSDIVFSYGDKLREPASARSILTSELQAKSKWTRLYGNPEIARTSPHTERLRLSEVFEIRRGIATGANEFFIMSKREALERDLPFQFLTPILPNPRRLDQSEVFADENGHPALPTQFFLVDCRLPESIIRRDYPKLWQYYQLGIERGIHERYLCQHRAPWYAQEQRTPAPLLCTYMGRQVAGRQGRPFRFILNHSNAIAANTYLMLLPKLWVRALIRDDPSILYRLWQTLGDIAVDELIESGRTYGGSLHKMEPKELANARIPNLFEGIATTAIEFEQLHLLERKSEYKHDQTPDP